MYDTPDDTVRPDHHGDDPDGDPDEFDLTPIVSFLSSHARCSAHNVKGEPCGQPVAVQGATVCRIHGGAAPQVQAAAVDRLRVVRDLGIDRLDRILTTNGDRLDPRVLLDIVTKLTDKIELLEGRATARTETSELRLEEVRKQFTVRLEALADSYRRAPAVLEMVDRMMGEDVEEATG